MRLNVPVFLAAIQVILAVACLLWAVACLRWPSTAFPLLWLVWSLATYGLVVWSSRGASR